MPDLLIAWSLAEQPDRKMVEWPESALAAQLTALFEEQLELHPEMAAAQLASPP